MADISIKDLRPAGYEFFADSEGYMTDLTEDELSVWGGSGSSDSSHSCGGGGSVASLSFASQVSAQSVLTLSAATGAGH